MHGLSGVILSLRLPLCSGLLDCMLLCLHVYNSFVPCIFTYKAHQDMHFQSEVVLHREKERERYEHRSQAASGNPKAYPLPRILVHMIDKPHLVHVGITFPIHHPRSADC